jgi:hypothetical protein
MHVTALHLLDCASRFSVLFSVCSPLISLLSLVTTSATPFVCWSEDEVVDVVVAGEDHELLGRHSSMFIKSR